MRRSTLFLAITLCLLPSALRAGDESDTRWSLEQKGPGIVWDIAEDADLPHADHLEMAGRRAALVVRYGVDSEGALTLERTVVWPMLRTVPNDTHASLMRSFGFEVDSRLEIDGEAAGAERPLRISFDGVLVIESGLSRGLRLTRTLFPSTEQAVVFEEVELHNEGSAPVTIAVRETRCSEILAAEQCVTGSYEIESSSSGVLEQRLGPGGSVSWTTAIWAHEVGEESWWEWKGVAEPLAARRAFARRLTSETLRLETPEPELDAAFALAKLRAAESIFATRGGLMHAPGGTRYYAAIWANDTIEYVAPFYPFLGDDGANEASWNALRHFARFTNPGYEMLPSSIIAEGDDVWMGAQDRGDAAMIAYGASRFALALGDRRVAEEVWPLIEWCLEYCERQRTEDGVIASDRDELEGRLPHGATNLSTSGLTYGGLVGAARLARSLGGSRVVLAELYERRARDLREAIESFFGAEVEGFHTYRYHEESEVLRSWICVPLTMGIFERREGTLDALFSERLWTEDGLKSIATDETFWDRSTLYGLRGAFAAGDTERALGFFRDFTRRRLLGDHVPYAVEAWPEGNQRHLSAESALYARVVIEGLFGIEPIALDTFACTPRLPADWEEMALRNVRAFGGRFDLVVRRRASGVEVEVRSSEESLLKQVVSTGGTVEVQLPPSVRDNPPIPPPDPVDRSLAGARQLSEKEALLATQQWGALRRDRSVSGTPLRIDGVMYTRGIGTHAESEIPLFHDRSAAHLHGLVGIDDAAGGSRVPASVIFEITSGEQLLWRSEEKRGGDSPSPFDVDLTGLSVVYLRATDAGDGNSYDHADWVELRVEPVEQVQGDVVPARFSVTDFGVVPGSGEDATAGIRAALSAARVVSGPVTIVFPPGRYDLFAASATSHRWFISNHDSLSPKHVAIPICGFEELTIESVGAQLVFHGRVLPLAISDSEKVTVRGVSIDFERPFHSQAEVLSSDDGVVELAIGTEYPHEVVDEQLRMIVDGGGERVWACMEFEGETGRIAFDTGDRPFRGRVEELAPGRVRVDGIGHRPTVGNTLVLRHGGRPHPGVFVQRSAEVFFDRVTVHQAEGMGFLVQRTRDFTLTGGGVHLAPGTSRVFTTSADATHFSNCSGTVEVRDALFEGMMDDAINVHGTYLQVQGVEPGGAVLARFKHSQSTGFDFALPGDRLRFVRSDTLLPYVEFPLARARRLSDTDLLLTFAGGPPAGLSAGDGIENAEATPAVFFRGNVVRNNRARGALFSSPRRTVVEDNLFDHSSGSAILLAGDCNGWFESGACQDVLIRNNRFVNCLTSRYQFTKAVISIHPEIPDLEGQQHPYHGNVRIEGNEFVTFDSPLLFARSVGGLVFRGNRIVPSEAYPALLPGRPRIHHEGCREVVIEE
jgi:hypothetical protein